MKKANRDRLAFLLIGRRGGIRTRDPLHPMQVRYQAALHAEKWNFSMLRNAHFQTVNERDEAIRARRREDCAIRLSNQWWYPAARAWERR